MNTVWKGLVIGGMAGAGVGAILDARHRGAGADGRERHDGKVPDAVGRVRGTLAAAASETASRVRDSDVPDQVRGAIGATRRKIDAAQERIRAGGDGTGT